MRTLFITLLAVALTTGVSAQIVEKEFTSPDTVAAETVYYPLGAKVKTTSGVVIFTGVKTDITDSLSTLVIQGANQSDFSDAADMTGTGVLAATTTNGAFQLYVTSPYYLYYRLKATAASGDSVKIVGLKGVYK